MEGNVMKKYYQNPTGKNKFKEPQFSIDLKIIKIMLIDSLKAFAIALLTGLAVIMYFFSGI